MLAKVPSDLPVQEVRPAPPSFTVTFNPNSITNHQFSLSDTEGPVANLVLIEEEMVTLEITLAGSNATISGIHWTLSPEDAPDPQPVGNTISFTIPQPKHPLRPWIFRLAVDTPEVEGVFSQSIFLAQPRGEHPENVFLHYLPESGTFNLSDSSDPISSATAGIPLKGNESVLINALNENRTFQVHLVVEDPPSSISSVSFADPPVVWSTAASPTWTGFTRQASNTIEIEIDSSTAEISAGQCIGLRFALEITGTDENTVTVLSPDPILINATIGDG